ncbi:MAG TPA: tetratricopeptide repeat protein [Xanthobacteraceae bacterium]|nr:tetratricopeptide repeat protein [Xanthobacteraceae bacterium]
MTPEPSRPSPVTARDETDLAALAATAEAHVQAGRLDEAQTAYRAALAIAPGNTALLQNLGAIAAMRGHYREAVALFDSVIAREPHSTAAHYNRALALLSLGQRRAAIEGFSRVCVLQPEHYEAHRTLGFLWLAEGNRGRALDHFARTCELRRGEDRSNLAGKSLTYATRDKLLHDAEQFHFLAKHARNGQRFTDLARTYEDVGRDFPEQLTRLSERQIGRLGDDYNCPINLRTAPEVAGRAVGERCDLGVLVHGFRASNAGAIYFDNLLTPEALKRLRSFLLESTIWHDFSHIGGFVASYLEDGLACPLILQIANEIRSTFAGLLTDHPLTQAWAFKGLKPSSAIDVHADDGAISVNFWVTPTDANQKPDAGGLVVSLVPPPKDWQMHDYTADQDRIVAFLEQNSRDRLRVPYRDNRAVLFSSRLFHWSDRPEFAPGYENHRVNLTFLYGRQSALPGA